MSDTLNAHPFPIRTTASILGRNHALIGMVHLLPLPGSPRAQASAKEIAAHAVKEARLLEQSGFDAVLIENMHDAPYMLRGVDPETIAAFTRAACEVRNAIKIPLGVQLLSHANRAALGIALAAEAAFIRAEGFVFAAVADEGLLARADAGDLLRARRAMGAEHIAIFADIKKKHSSHAITADTSLDEHAKTAEFFGANGVIVTGTATGVATPLADLASAKAATPLVVLAGSGVTSESVRATLATCDGVIVGSDLKVDGRWYNALDLHRVERLVRAARS
jgi:uncharacterized protein